MLDKLRFNIIVSLTASLLLAISAPAGSKPDSKPDYPASPRGNVVDVMHGVKIPDPYRWLEDLESKQTMDWVKAQDELFLAYVGEVSLRDKLESRIEAISHYDRDSAPVSAVHTISPRSACAACWAGPAMSRLKLTGFLSSYPRLFAGMWKISSSCALRN